MEQVIITVMQLCEVFASRIGSGQTLTEDEVLMYNQGLNTIKKSMEFFEMNYDKAIEEFPQGETESENC